MTIGRYRAGRKPAHLHESFSRAFPRSLTPCAFPCEATAVWQWSNHSRSRTQAGRQTLCINIDETAICLFQGHGEGNLFCSKKTQNVSRWAQRVHLTLVAFLCEDAALQSKMPQILIGNERTIPANSLGALRASLPHNCHLVRAPSAWVDGYKFALAVKFLGVAMAPYAEEYQVVLYFDAYKAHLAPVVWSACAAARIIPVVIPARLTWLLQPLDAHVFAAFKVRLQREYQTARLDNPDGVCGVCELLLAVRRAIAEVLEGRSWAHAFQHTGFGADQGGISLRVLGQVGVQLPLAIPSTRPSDDQVQSCLPEKMRVNIAAMFKELSAKPALPAVSSGGSSASSGHALMAFGCDYIAMNTRSRTRARGEAAPSHE